MTEDGTPRTPTAMIAAGLQMAPELVPVAHELLADFEELGSDAEQIAGALAHVGIGPDDHVVDLGAGNGTVAIHVARQLGCRVTGVELHEPFVAGALAAASDAGLSERCRFVHGDIAALAGALPSADAAIYAALGDVFGPLDATVRLVRRYVRPGGYLVVSDCYLADGAGPASFPGYEQYRDLAGTRRLLTAAGDELVHEVRLEAESRSDVDAASDAQDVARIARRAAVIAAANPHLADPLEAFVRSQADELEFIAGSTHDAVWVLRLA